MCRYQDSVEYCVNIEHNVVSCGKQRQAAVAPIHMKHDAFKHRDVVKLILHSFSTDAYVYRANMFVRMDFVVVFSVVIIIVMFFRSLEQIQKNPLYIYIYVYQQVFVCCYVLYFVLLQYFTIHILCRRNQIPTAYILESQL